MFLLQRNSQIHLSASAPFRPNVISSVKLLIDRLKRMPKDSILISYDRDLTTAFLKCNVPGVTRHAAGLFFHEIETRDIPELSILFRKLVFAEGNGFVTSDELAEILNAENRSELAIGGIVNGKTERITLWRGNFEPMTIPFSAFETAGDGTAPDFSRFSIIDCGQTVKLGDYEAAIDAILYEFDPDYRRELSKKRRQEDRSFGAALLRLRKQRGLSRKDFESEVAAKTIARIETGKASPDRIRKSTLEAIGRILDVEPDEIASF